MLDCPDLAVPVEIMHHVVHVESARNPFAIGVVGGRLSRQPRSLDEALAAVQTLKEQGYNFSVGIAQVNRYNLARYGLSSYAQAFETCPNLKAGSQILKECHDRARDWGKAFSCYYSGNFVTGFEHGYVQKVFDSMQRAAPSGVRVADITVIPRTDRSVRRPARDDGVPLRADAATSAPVSTAPSIDAAAGRGNVPASGAVSGHVGQIPVQLVGAQGDPYRVTVQPARSSARPAVSRSSPKGEYSTPPANPREASTERGVSPAVASPKEDQSFVF
jgi:Transglycosylase SLT domain